MPTVATIGFFDGVHKGHQYLFEQLRLQAQAHEERALIFTFLQHPRSVLTHDCPPLLTTLDEREMLIGQYGDVHFFDFAEVQPLTAAQFLDYLSDRWKVRHLLMGYNHHFGSDGRLSDEQYASVARQVGIEVLRLPPYVEDETRPSSTRIRNALLQGDISGANQMLGYAYHLSGRVVHGRMIGRQIGFPTANIMPDPAKLIPAAGVYKVMVNDERTSDEWVMALVNIGTNPTVGNAHQTIEVHIPGYDGDLYNRTLTLQFLERLRGEQRFDSLDELREQIHKDLQRI